MKSNTKYHGQTQCAAMMLICTLGGELSNLNGEFTGGIRALEVSGNFACNGSHEYNTASGLANQGQEGLTAEH